MSEDIFTMASIQDVPISRPDEEAIMSQVAEALVREYIKESIGFFEEIAGEEVDFYLA
jgi:hypothetical protein